MVTIKGGIKLGIGATVEDKRKLIDAVVETGNPLITALSSKPKQKEKEHKKNTLSRSDLDKMSKEELDKWAKDYLNIEIDRRKSKKTMIGKIWESMKNALK